MVRVWVVVILFTVFGLYANFSYDDTNFYYILLQNIRNMPVIKVVADVICVFRKVNRAEVLLYILVLSVFDVVLD